MKKIILAIAVLAMSAFAASAQDREIDLQNWDEFNKVDLTKGKTRVESNLTFAFPMYFGWTAMTNINYKGDWAGTANGFMNFNLGKSFVYGLQVAGVDVRYGALGFSMGLRFTFMDFTFQDSRTTLAPVGGTYFPTPILDPSYDGRKSKIHASYFGVPARLSLNVGKFTVYAGASAEFLINGYSKYKRPKNRTQMKPAFNQFRATVEGGASYGNIGVFVIYGLTPLFPQDLSDARTLTFGILLGL